MSRSILNELFALNRKNRLLPLLRFLNKNSTGFNQDVDLLSGAIVTLFMVVLQIPLEQQNDSPFAHMPYILSNTLKCSDANFLCDYVLSCINDPLVTSQILKDVLPDEEETIDSFRTETDLSAIESAPFMKPIGEGATVSITPGFTVIPTDTPKSDLFKLDVDNHILEMNRIITEFLDLKHIPNLSTETERNNSSTSSTNNGDSSNSPPDFTTPVTEENTDSIQQETTPDNTYNYYDAFFQTNNNNQTTSYEEPGTTNPARRTRTRRNSTHLDFTEPFQHPQFTTSTTPRANATQMHIPEQLNYLEQQLDNTEQQSSNSNQQLNDPGQSTNSNSTETPHTPQVSDSEHSLNASITQSITSSNNSRSSSPERPSSLYFQRRRGAVIESSGDAPTAIANTTQPQENENNDRSHNIEHIRPPPASLPLSLPVAFRTENILDSSNETNSPPERSQTIQNMLDDIGRSIDEAAAFSINVFSDISLRNEETTGDTNPTSFADISVNDNPNTQTPQSSNDYSLTRQLQEAEQIDSIYQNQAPYNASTHPGAMMNATEQNDSINQTREPSSTSSLQVAMINITEQTEDTRQTEQNEPELFISQLLGLGESQPIEFQTFDNAQDAAQHNNTTGQLLPPLSEYNAAGAIPLVQEANPNQNLNEPETEHIENVIPRVPPQFTNRITTDGLSTVTATHIERENADSLGGNSSALSTQLTESASSDRSQPASNPNILAPQPDFRMPLAPTSGGGASSSSSLNNPTSSQMFTLSSDASHYQADSNNNGGFLQNQRVIEDVLEEIENRASVPTARFNILEFSTNDYGPLGQLLADLETANFKAIQRFRAKFAHLITQAEHILGSDKIESFNEIHSLASNNRLTEETVTKLRLLQQAYNYFTRHIFNFEVFAHQYETYYVATQSLHLLQAFYIKSRTLIRMMAENSRLTVGVVLKVKPTVQEVVQMAFSIETLAKLYKLNNSAFTEENICRNLDRNLKVMVEDCYRLGEEFKTAYQHHWCTPFHPLPHMLDLPDILELDEEDGSNAYRTPTFKQPNTTIV